MEAAAASDANVLITGGALLGFSRKALWLRLRAERRDEPEPDDDGA